VEISQSLVTVMKRLKLSGLLPTLPDRVAYARKAKLSELDFLELALQDEVDRRDQQNLALRVQRAGFEEEQTLEGFDWDAPVTFDRDRVKELFGLGFLGLGASSSLNSIAYFAARYRRVRSCSAGFSTRS